MTKYLAGVLSVIAVGVLLIAYGLLSPRVNAFGSPADMGPSARPMLASEQSLDPYAMRAAYAAGYANPYAAQAPAFNYPAAPQAVPVSSVRPVRTVQTSSASAMSRASETRVDSKRRDWKKTALVIGGSTAGGAGLGGIFAGKKGALIGAAIGGGASTIYEATKN